MEQTELMRAMRSAILASLQAEKKSSTVYAIARERMAHVIDNTTGTEEQVDVFRTEYQAAYDAVIKDLKEERPNEDAHQTPAARTIRSYKSSISSAVLLGCFKILPYNQLLNEIKLARAANADNSEAEAESEAQAAVEAEARQMAIDDAVREALGDAVTITDVDDLVRYGSERFGIDVLLQAVVAAAEAEANQAANG